MQSSHEQGKHDRRLWVIALNITEIMLQMKRWGAPRISGIPVVAIRTTAGDDTGELIVVLL